MIHIQPDEKVILEVRRHWYVLFAESFFLFLLSLVPFAVFGFLSLSPEFLQSQKLIALFTYGSAAWLLVMWVIFFIVWTNYHLDVWIVTDRRVIDIEQHHLFSREVSEFKLERIQDITIEVHDPIATLLHFGDLHVQTAGQTRRFVIKQVSHPEKIKEIIFEQHDKILKQFPKAE